MPPGDDDGSIVGAEPQDVVSRHAKCYRAPHRRARNRVTLTVSNANHASVKPATRSVIERTLWPERTRAERRRDGNTRACRGRARRLPSRGPSQLIDDWSQHAAERGSIGGGMLIWGE